MSLPAPDQLKSLIERIERVEESTHAIRTTMIDHVAETLPRCVGLDERTTHRAFWIASRLLGMRYERGRLACSALLVGSRKLAEANVWNYDKKLVGFVYIAKPLSGEKIYKIGFSLDPFQRIKDLSQIVGCPLVLSSYYRGTMLNELADQCAHRHRRIYGEWFREIWESPSNAAEAVPESAAINPVAKVEEEFADKSAASSDDPASRADDVRVPQHVSTAGFTEACCAEGNEQAAEASVSVGEGGHIILPAILAGSSNGRTPEFDSGNAGSTPAPASSFTSREHVLRPHCQKPGAQDCGGVGSKHCYSCEKLMRGSEAA